MFLSGSVFSVSRCPMFIVEAGPTIFDEQQEKNYESEECGVRGGLFGSVRPYYTILVQQNLPAQQQHKS